jgi:hypothetical protein
MERLTCVASIALCLAACSVPVTASSETPSGVTSRPEPAQFTLVSWNVDSGGADPQVAALWISEMKGVALWGLCEVRNDIWAKLFEEAADGVEPGRFIRILSPTGGSDRSCILYDKTQFDCLGWFELSWAGHPWYRRELYLRPGLVAHLRHRATRQALYFMVNRFYETAADKQAAALSEWAGRQDIPVLAVGTYDFEYRPEAQLSSAAGRRGDPALTDTGVFRWLMPDNPIPTVSRGGQGVSDDFVFLADRQHRLTGRSEVIVPPDDLPSDLMPDHRPVSATITIRPAGE